MAQVWLGLKSLATGLPKSWFLGERIAYADSPTPQYLILATSSNGDPLNANAPGSYVPGAQNSPIPDLAAANVTFGDASYQAAKCWGSLPDDLRARMAFFHHRTYTNAHPEHRKVMALQGAAKLATGNGQEMLPSVFGRAIRHARHDSDGADPARQRAHDLRSKAARSATSRRAISSRCSPSPTTC